MIRFDWRVFVFLLAILSTTAFAADVIFGETDEDLLFFTEVLIDGVNLPEDYGDTTLQSSVDFLGTGTLTVVHQSGGGYPRITVFGGTTITSEREWQDDGETRTAWEGFLESPLYGQTPSLGDVVFSVEGNHEFSTIYPVATFKLGLSNEKFSFSTPALFALPVEIPDGKKLWYAFRETVAPGEESEWVIEEENFCIVTDGLCVDVWSEFNEVLLAQEFFTQCPRSRSSDTKIQNGFISGPPTCAIECNRGYKLNEIGNGCIKTVNIPEDSDSSGGEEENQDSTEAPEKEPASVRQGYFRFTNARGQIDRHLDASGLEGDKKIQIERQNAALLRTAGEGQPVEEEEPQEIGKDSFLNYLLQIRNYFGDTQANTFAAETTTGDSADQSEEGSPETNNSEEGGGTYSSAPLLPSTGPGIFVGLAALGLGLMIFGIKSRR
ncbi:hypothetical protein K9M59_02340 [Candidatus Gracilibacteria bacterium]|nr:hypothetical protein [Candidatus Gracilibacteria bacterium]MCF7819681.1 hypothetical protein [Candidatus Gracilibacteria bacterium]